VPSASELNLLAEPRAARAYEKMDLLAVGDPALASRRQGSRGKGKLPAGVAAPVAWVADDLRLAALPNTRREVEAIGEMFAPAARKLYFGEGASESLFKLEDLRRYRRIHFATHGLFDAQTIARSGLMLAPGGGDDGLLTADEIAEMDLEAELVVLSACNTGAGRLANSEGVVGLTRAFLHAGAEEVAVSLWGVSDLTTADFMRQFYGRLSAGVEPAAALREAKLEMISGRGAERHPYYWAPFVLVGHRHTAKPPG
jgi:CHAT domain-containing protein